MRRHPRKFAQSSFFPDSETNDKKSVKSNYRSSDGTPEEPEELPKEATIEFQILPIEAADMATGALQQALPKEENLRF